MALEIDESSYRKLGSPRKHRNLVNLQIRGISDFADFPLSIRDLQQLPVGRPLTSTRVLGEVKKDSLCPVVKHRKLGKIPHLSR